MRLTSRDARHARWIREQIAMQRAGARTEYVIAWWLDRFGRREAAHERRHRARLDLMMAAKMQRGLDTGAYRLGRRQYPYVEETCGCARYCRPERA